ncbi:MULTISPECIES: hypothetical protein [unclassified Corynebacterium]|uniref:hypothetical protein n=1 Tax=unclassified Corynebacterium TaxID=2624378 RepID=UPI00264D2FBB|nr:hypothetical protein [Corynebacterium sp.]MDN6332246.1 hypothetical protein [Micrococcaceae bacterium]
MTDRKKPGNALYIERIRLLRSDPDRYFREYPKPEFGFRQEHKHTPEPDTTPEK